jgi:thymidylate kinase
VSTHKIITITGLDRVGKETQSKLLARSLQPARRMTFPNYSHWGGRIVKAILQEKPFYLFHEGETVPGWEETAGGNGPLRPNGATWTPYRHTQDKHPEIFQMLQSVDRVAAQEEIQDGLRHHHWVMDRYEVDALAYGLIDGCGLEWLLAMDRLYRPSDLAIIMLGTPFARPGEIPDLNERDTLFQLRVQEAYGALASLLPHRLVLLNVDPYRDLGDPYRSMGEIQQKIHQILRERLGLGDFEYPSTKWVYDVLNGTR